MLVGSIKYRDEDLGELTFATYAKHSVSKIAFHIMQSDLDKNTSFLEYDAKYMKVLDKTRDESGNIVAAFKDGVEWEIKGEKTNVTAPTERDIVVNTASNKVATNVGNMDLAVRLGAIIAYCKQNAQGRISEDDEFSDILKGHLDNKSDSKYKDITVTCDIVYKQSEIIKLDIESKYFSIHLDYADEQNLSVAYFKPLKQKDKWGNPLSITPIKNVTVKMTENTLGWKIEQKIKQTVSIMGMYQRIEDVIAAHPEKNTDWILDRKYEIVTDDNLEEVIKEFMDYDGYIAFDTETTGLKINFLSREGRGDQLVGCVLSMKPGTGYYFPVKHKYIKNLCNGDDNFFMQHYMKPILEGKKIVTHNCKYDWKVAYIYGIVVNVVYDTMIALGVTKRYEILNFELGLKSLAHSLLGLDMFDLDDFIIGDNEWGDDGAITFADLPYELVRRYAPADGDMTLSLMQYIEKNHIIENYNAAEVFQLEVEFSKVVAYSEFWGYHIDVEGIPELQKKIMGEMEKHQQAAFEIAGHEFNMNSPIQLNKVMYDELGIEQVEGKKGTDKNILKILSEMEDENGEPKYPFVKHLKAYRDAEAIYKNFLKKLHIFATDDGYIFPDVLFLGTETGRCSVKNPNYQSYNDTVKHYVVPRKGYIMGDSDFGQIEYRTLASMADEKTLIEAFDDPDLDYHQYQASRMFNVPYAAVTKKLRQQSKGINFGLPYGMGDASLGARIFGQRTPENTKKAAALREKFFEGQDHIRAFFDKVRAGGVANGYTETLKHRRRYYHKGKFSEAEIRRQAGNHAIQGCLSGDVRIQTKELGIVKLKNVVGQTLTVWDGFDWTKGTVTYSGKKQKCIVHFDGGLSIICSPTHKFLVVSKKGNKRFVECKDLFSREEKKNAHRVVVNSNYKESDYVYSSDDFKDFISISHNANNVFIDNISDRFAAGVILGRLASNGSISLREDGGSYIQQIIAEHEFSIIPILKKYMQELGCVVKIQEVRENRNQKIANINVYSKSLTKEVIALDIKHQIHDNIFMDTEVLRGFLRGFFDGDGGISGKTISLTFGTQFNFEPMCLDIQKALLFFGIRSRYRKYSERYVLQIKTHDNARFCQLIGFVNSKKQLQGESLYTAEDEHIFGHNLMVKSVEIIDDYIDMYDVCNTERGYFVADGIITHNSAADIYKMAVVRFFQFIMGNGLRDKVLIDAFIHDEILFEIHESVDVLWLTTEWRKAFEVPLEGFCKLYAGLGYGKCWYDAKKQDLPTGFITALCELALDKSRPLKDDIFTNVDPNTGYVWHNDIEQFIKDVKFWFNNYKFQRVFDYVQEEDKQGAIIKPAIWSLLTECVSELIPIELQQRNKDDKGREYCMQLIDRIEKEVGQGIINFDILDNKCTIKCRDLQEYIKVFCIYKGIDYTKVNILAPDGVKDSNKVEAKDDVQRDKEEVIKQVNTFDLFHELLKSDNYEFDIFTDNESRLLYVNADDTIILNMVKEKAIKNPKGYDMSTLYKIMLVVRKPTPAEADTNCFIRLSDINAINWQYNMAKSMMGVKKNGNS